MLKLQWFLKGEVMIIMVVGWCCWWWKGNPTNALCGARFFLANYDDYYDNSALKSNWLTGSFNWQRMITIMTLMMMMTTSFSKIHLMFKVHPIGGGEQHAGVPGHRQRCPREQDHPHHKQSSKLFFIVAIFFKAFGSISMMLESSFHAVHSSFQVETLKWVGP